MIARYVDNRAGRDFLASGMGIILGAVMLVLMANWYATPPSAVRPPPVRTRVTYVVNPAAASRPAPIYFSLPSDIGFSRTVQPGDPRIATTLGPRVTDVGFLPREPLPEHGLAMSGKTSTPVFQPWREEEPVFKPFGPGSLAWKMAAEPMNGRGLVLPDGFQEAAQWPASGAWSAVMRLEAGEDGRIRHAFLMPPFPEAELGRKLEQLMRKARLEGERDCRVKISRVEVPAGAEGVRP